MHRGVSLEVVWFLTTNIIDAKLYKYSTVSMSDFLNLPLQ